MSEESTAPAAAPAADGALVRQAEPTTLATQRHYRIKRPWLSWFNRIFRVFAPDGQLFMMVKHPVLKLREEFQVYGDEAQTRPLLKVKSRQAIAINFTYDVTDLESGQLLGSIQKRGLKSIIRDKFIILDPGGVEIGYAEEKGASLLRRIFPFLTSKHGIYINGAEVGFVRQIFRFFIKEFDVRLEPSQVDPRFVLAVALLALMAEARRESES